MRGPQLTALKVPSGAFISSTGLEPVLLATHDAGEELDKAPGSTFERIGSAAIVRRLAWIIWGDSRTHTPPTTALSAGIYANCPTTDGRSLSKLADLAVGYCDKPPAGRSGTCQGDLRLRADQCLYIQLVRCRHDMEVVPATLGSVGYESDIDWWVIDNRGLYKSHDAGQTWTKISDQLPEWNFYPHVLDSKHARAMLSGVGGWGLAQTSHGVLHWTRATVPQKS